MIKINKQLSIKVLKALKNFTTAINLKDELFSVVETDQLLFKVIDKDKFSDFYFSINRFDEQGGYSLSYKPADRNNVNERHLWTNEEDISAAFKIWHSCMAEYAEFEKEQNDPFLKSLEDEFFNGLSIDEESKNKPLNIKEIFLLEGHLSTIIDEIRTYENGENSVQIEGIIEEAINLRSNLGNQTKEWIAKKFSSILAKITKEGPEILKGIFKETGKQIMTQGIKFLLEHGAEIIK